MEAWESNMKSIRFIVFTVLAAIGIICLLTIIARMFGYDFRIVKITKPVGIPTYDEKFRLVETSDHTGRYLLYSVIQLGDETRPPRTVFTADDYWFYSQFIDDYGWEDGTYDFYIHSTDEGKFTYRFNGSSWLLID